MNHKIMFTVLMLINSHLFAKNATLVPLNRIGIKIVSEALEVDERYNYLRISKKAYWPNVCNSDNKIESEVKAGQLRIYTLYVTPECNQQLTQGQHQLTHIRFSNESQLLFKSGEVTALAHINLESVPEEWNHQLLVLDANFFADDEFNFKNLNGNPSKANADIWRKHSRKPTHLELYTMTGITHRLALDLSGDYLPNSATCDKSHEKNDVANNYCHGMMTNTIQQSLMNTGMNPYLSHFLGTSVFAIKEAVDPRFTLDDVGFVNLRLFDTQTEVGRSQILGTFFLGGTFYFAAETEF